MFQYQKFNRYFAQVTDGIETFCEEELRELGALNTMRSYHGVSFDGNKAILYRIIYQSRLAMRVLAPLLTFDCHSDRYLKKTVATIPWNDILSLDKTFAVNASVSNSTITHSLYAALCVKDGIADFFRALYGERPNVDTENPDVRINLHLERNKALISLDLSGESLHKRGYRQSGGIAPMQETLAAALVHISGWNGDRPLLDCLCGSGTILCEALMHFTKTPAQYLRKKFGFFHLPDFDAGIWDKVKTDSEKLMRPLPDGLIHGSDMSQNAIDTARQNLRRLPFNDKVSLSCEPFQSIEKFEKGMIITNPPYGIRIGTKEDVSKLYKEIGDFLKKKCVGTTAFIFVGDPSLRKSIGLKPGRRIPLANGQLDGELVQIDSYKIPFRDKPAEPVSSKQPQSI